MLPGNITRYVSAKHRKASAQADTLLKRSSSLHQLQATTTGSGCFLHPAGFRALCSELISESYCCCTAARVSDRDRWMAQQGLTRCDDTKCESSLQSPAHHLPLSQLHSCPHPFGACRGRDRRLLAPSSTHTSHRGAAVPKSW